MARLAVIGGAGYVGLHLCRELVRRGHDIVAITRANGRFLLEPLGVTVVAPEEAAQAGRADVVVNLAYPNAGPDHEVPSRNRELVDLIRQLTSDPARIVQVSSLAVFGFALERPPAPVPVPRRRDYVYVESKIDLECRLREWSGPLSLDIVRLGNVWGPASPTWTAALADRLTFGAAVGVRDEDGYCNATDVANVASYLASLAEQPAEVGARYHHLAEFSAVRWSWWVARMAAHLQVAPVYGAAVGDQPPGFVDEIVQSLRKHSPLAIASEWMSGRYTGSLVRSTQRLLPPTVVRKLNFAARGRRRAAAPPVDPAFLAVMTARQEFVSHLRGGWVPEVDQEASWGRVAAWLDRAGYP